jgi:hypothetical protein
MYVARALWPSAPGQTYPSL